MDIGLFACALSSEPRGRLEAFGRECDIDPTICKSPDEMVAALQDSESEAVVIIGDRLDNPLQCAQRVSSVADQPHLLLLTPREKYASLHQAVLTSPFLSSDTRCLATDDLTAFAATLAKVVAGARKHQRNRAMVKFASASLGRSESVAPTANLILDRLLQGAPIGVAVCDTAGKVVAWNREANAITHVTEREALGRPLSGLLGQEDDAKKLVDSLLEGGKGVTLALRRSNQQTVFLDASAQLLKQGNEPERVMVVIHDVTTRVQAAELLVRTEKLASLQGMVAGIAHEINTPLGTAITALSMLDQVCERVMNASDQEQRKAATNKLSDCMTLMHNSLQRTADLVNSFKRVATDSGEDSYRTFSVHPILESIIATNKPQWSAVTDNVELKCPDDLQITSYPAALTRIFEQLLSGSVQHGYAPDERGKIRIEAQRADHTVVFTYSDDGRGMKEGDAARVFEPFFTTRRRFGSTGLGMHMVYNIVTLQLNGTVKVTTSPGGGFQCTVSIPAVSPSPDHLGFRQSEQLV